MSTTRNRPFLRIAATYQPTEDSRIPSSVEIELDVDAAPDEEPLPDDGSFPSHGFTGFVVEVVKALGGVAGDRPATVNVFRLAVPAGDVGDLLGHAPGCDGTCQHTDAVAAVDPAPTGDQTAGPPPLRAWPTATDSEKGGA